MCVCVYVCVYVCIALFVSLYLDCIVGFIVGPRLVLMMVPVSGRFVGSSSD